MLIYVEGPRAASRAYGSDAFRLRVPAPAPISCAVPPMAAHSPKTPATLDAVHFHRGVKTQRGRAAAGPTR